jgi:exosortase/archaeosortase family protein
MRRDKFCRAVERSGAGVHPARWVICGAVLAVLLVAGGCFPGFFLFAIGYPSAWLTSFWMHAPLASTVDGWLIAPAGLGVHVTIACNGAGFFALLSALAVARRPAWRPAGRALVRIVAGLTLVWAVAVLANAARLVVVRYAALGVHGLGVPRLAAAAHYGAGLVVFFVVLVAFHFLLERIPCE